MIGMLKGMIAAVSEDGALIDVGGVGYEVNAGARLVQNLAVGEAAVLSIDTIVREDFIRLYGFASAHERDCFRILQTVQGVGARHALAILDVLTTDDLYEAVAGEDAGALARAHGVGKKIAQRIVVELQSKLGALAPARLAGQTGDSALKQSVAKTSEAKASSAPSPVGASSAARADATSALVNLGYDGVAARRAVSVAMQEGGDDLDVGAVVKRALKELAPA